MARKPKTEPTDNAALVIDAGEVIAKMKAFNERDSERASDAGEDRQKIGAYLNDTGLNAKAFSHLRMVLRMKKPTAKADWLRTMQTLFPIVQAEIERQDEMQFGAPEAAKAAATAAE